MGDRLSVGDNVAVLYFAPRVAGGAKEWFIVYGSNVSGQALKEVPVIQEVYRSIEYEHEGRIVIRCTEPWSSLHDRFHGDGGGFAIDHWPGQTLSIPLAGDTKDKYDTYIMELLNCMHREMTSGMHVPREPYPWARRGTRDPGEARDRHGDAAVSRLRRFNTWGVPGRGRRADPVAPGGRDPPEAPYGDGGYAPGRAVEPTSFDRGTTKEFLKFLERVVDHYFDCVAAEPR